MRFAHKKRNIVYLQWFKDLGRLALTGNFSQAAHLNNISQSAFSRRIKALEEWVGTPLVDRSRLDLFTSFLDPAGVEPKRVRHAELTTMIVQLVASGRGVACLPNWALFEYTQKDYLAVRSLGEEGIWPTLYAAVRNDQAEAAFMKAFVTVARQTCFANLHGIVTADLG